jgi:signal transduction histidine kinase
MDVIRWLGGRDYTPGTPVDLRWAWVTVSLSVLVALGYGVIAFNRYFQTKLDRRADARAAAARLRNIVMCCCACGYIFFATDVGWRLWRLYDLALACLVLYTWSFVLRTRGLSLVEARLAQVEELERSAEQQKAIALQKEMQARQKTFFLNALSHDLRAPLNIVALNAHLLKTGAREQADVDSAKLIIENAVAAGDLVTKALELAKADAEDQNVVEPVRVSGLVGPIVRRFLPVAQEKGLYLRVAGGAAHDAELLTDRQKLERVIANLVDNAIKFTDRGGVTLELDTQAELLTVRVCDTGIGVAAENVPYLFDEFYQAEDHEGRRKGFGMGLAICRFLTRQLGGDVRLDSTSPGGSCFVVTLPAVAAAPVLSHASVESADPADPVRTHP